MNKKAQLYYDVVISILALVYCFILVVFEFSPRYENIPEKLIVIFDSIYLIFVVDYILRLLYSKDKKKFIIKNRWDLISIIPFYLILEELKIFKIGKIIKVTKLFKIVTLFRIVLVVERIKERVTDFIKVIKIEDIDSQ